MTNYENPKVLQIREELGVFDYEEQINLHSPVEHRAMVELKNHAKYEGEWIKGR